MPIIVDSTPIVKSIEQKSARVKALATQISERVIRMQEWLNTLPGRVEATTWIEDPTAGDDPRDIYFGINLARSGKDWVLQCARCEAGDDQFAWMPLTDASLPDKMLALKAFPGLLSSIEEAQSSLNEKMDAALKEFDQFAQMNGIVGKAGK